MNLPHEFYTVLAVLVSALTLASVIGYVLSRVARDEKGSKVVQNLNARIRAWWAIVALTAAACVIGRGALVALFAAVSFCALREIVTIIPSRRADRSALLCSFLIVLPLQYALIWRGWYGLFAVLIPVYAFLALPILAMLSADPRDFLTRTAQTQWGVMIAVYCISYAPALATLQVPGFEGRAMLLIVFLLVVVQSSDVLQYVFGKLFGRHCIAPHLSPSKTIEGLIGGLAGATLVGLALSNITPFTRPQAAVMAFIVSGAGFLGGLVMSGIKRDRGIKDWGHLIGGHGGMLDRLDSVCFSAPIFFHLTRYFFMPHVA